GIDTQEKHLEAARQRLLWFVTAYPKNVAPLIMLGEVDGEMGDQADALLRYRAALALDGSNVITLNNLAYTLAVTQPADALKYDQHAAEIAPDSAMVHDTLGWVYYKKMIYGTAVAYLEKAVAEEPTPKRQFLLAVCYLKQGQRTVGEKTLQL